MEAIVTFAAAALVGLVGSIRWAVLRWSYGSEGIAWLLAPLRLKLLAFLSWPGWKRRIRGEVARLADERGLELEKLRSRVSVSAQLAAPFVVGCLSVGLGLASVGSALQENESVANVRAEASAKLSEFWRNLGQSAVHFELGEMVLNANQLAEAKSLIEDVEADFPEASGLPWVRGMVAYSEGEPRRAFMELARVAASPEDENAASAFFSMANLLVGMGNTGEAMRAYRTSVGLDPYFADRGAEILEAAAQATSLPGVFPVTDGGLEPKTYGSAFVVDKEAGLLLTAAHVLHDLGLAVGDEVSLLFIHKPTYGDVYSEPMSASVVASGFDKGEPGAGSTTDWAVLRAHDPQMLSAFKDINVDRDQPEAPKNLAGVAAYGYPNQAETARPRPQTFSSIPHNGLWVSQGLVEGGFSGGPSLREREQGFQLVGLVLKQLEDPQFHAVLPAFALMDELVKHRRSERVQRAYDLVATTEDWNDRVQNEVGRSLDVLNGLDHWAFIERLKGLSQANKALVEYVRSYYLEAASGVFARAVDRVISGLVK